MQNKGQCCDILLVGQPNVGKSVLFSKLTGIRTITSNYAGTTVSYSSGILNLGGQDYTVIDAPGTYSLEPLDDAAKVTLDLVDSAKRIINVVDSTHLERNLALTFELLAQKKPMLLALNLSDEARHKGINIDVDKLKKHLGIPVVAVSALTGEGMNSLLSIIQAVPAGAEIPVDEPSHPAHHPHIPDTKHSEEEHKGHIHLDPKNVWRKIADISSDVESFTNKRHSFTDWLDDVSLNPVWGALMAIVVLVLSFLLVRLIGENLVAAAEYLFDLLWFPVVAKLSAFLGGHGFIHSVLVGSLIDGQIDFKQSFGVLTSGLFIPFAAVLPYIVSFYFVLSILEDTGYLPRLAVFMDSIMHRVGLHGYAIIPTMLGLGCNVPGILATRVLETKEQRFITATLISIAVPCVPMQAMIIGALGHYGVWPIALVYGSLILVWFIVGFLLKYYVKEYRPELLIEIPPYRLPSLKALGTKLYMRVWEFLKDALWLVMLAILAVDILYYAGVFNYIADLTSPVVTALWGMPKDAIIPLLIGILRKDAAVGVFSSLNLDLKQLVTGIVILAMFFPCVASFSVLVKELGTKYALKSITIVLISASIAGALINFFWA